jgi:beta-1,4-galactosyltransferase 1
MDKHKLGIIVPYRDRYAQLYNFKSEITKHLKKKGIDFEIIIVEQDDSKMFNRGKLLNIGFVYAKKMGCDYVIFHDVDMLPCDVDYSYSDFPIHLATNFNLIEEFKRIIFDEYFGGVTLFPNELFEKINGYSNTYWGWGFEDDDLLFRCVLNGIPLDKKKKETKGGNTAALSFNGESSYVKGDNNFFNNNYLTFFVNFYPDDIKCVPDKYDDTYPVFTIPGHDLRISYDSYKRYKFELYDDNENVIYFNSDITTNYKTSICVTIDKEKKEISFYQDGVKVETKKYENELHDYENEKYFYLGSNNQRSREDKKYFGGSIGVFAVFNKILGEKEIIEISENSCFGLTQNFGNYVSDRNLILNYDPKFIKGYKLMDLSGNGNEGKISNCTIVKYDFDEYKIINIPFRRECTFDLVPHEENGFLGNSWKDLATRYNQMRFYNEISKGYLNTKEDGLTNLKFKELSNSNVDKQTHITVSI